MHQVARAAVLAIAALGISARVTNAQEPGPATPAVAAINAVIGYRLSWISDSTAFDACSVYRAAGASPQQVASGLLPGFRDWFTAHAKPCGDPAAVDKSREVRVLVDSLSLSGSTGRVYLTVRRGEQTHQEEYHLVNPTPGRRWAVDRVVLSGAIRDYWLRPGTGPGTRP